MVEAGGCVPSLRAKLPKATSHAAVLLEEACTRHTCSCVHASLRAPGVVHVHEWADMQRLGADVTSRVEHKAHTLTPGGVGHLRAQACTCLLGVRCQRQAGATSEGGFPPLTASAVRPAAALGQCACCCSCQSVDKALAHTAASQHVLQVPCPHVVCHTHTRTRHRGVVWRHSPDAPLLCTWPACCWRQQSSSRQRWGFACSHQPLGWSAAAPCLQQESPSRTAQHSTRVQDRTC